MSNKLHFHTLKIPPNFAANNNEYKDMKQLLALLFLFFGLSEASGQQRVYSLKECVEIGIRNNISLKNSRLSILKGKTTLTQSRSKLLPVLSADFQMVDYLMKPANVTTGTLLGTDFPDEPTWQKIQSMQYTMTASIKLGVPLYNQTLLSAIKVARTMQELNKLSYEKAVEDLTVQICNVYYLAQASLELQSLLDENIHRMKELCAITEELYKGGVVLEIDLTRIQINLKGLVAQHDQYATLYEQQLNLLRYLLDLSPETPMGVSRMPQEISLLQAEGVSSSLPELKLLSTKQELTKRQARAVRAGYIPSVSLSGQLGAVGYQEKFKHFFHTSGETHNWFGNTYLALSVHIPIFDGNDKKLKIRQYEYDKQQAENAFNLQRKQLDKEYADASRQLQHNLEVYDTQKDSYRQAQDVYAVTEEKYKEGVASMTELLQDEMRLRNAQSACVQGHCQCNIAQLALMKLSGNLDRLTQ